MKWYGVKQFVGHWVATLPRVPHRKKRCGIACSVAFSNETPLNPVHFHTFIDINFP